MASHEDLSDSLETYLTDHLAGAEGALRLMDDLREGGKDEDFVAFIAHLRDEVAEDRDQLVAIMERFEVSPGRVKRALASVAETLGRTKLARLGEPASLSRLLAMETLSGGIWTKMRLWQALQAAPDLRPGLADVDLAGLIERARRQLDALEPHHAAAARRALSRPG